MGINVVATLSAEPGSESASAPVAMYVKQGGVPSSTSYDVEALELIPGTSYTNITVAHSTCLDEPDSLYFLVELDSEAADPDVEYAIRFTVEEYASSELVASMDTGVRTEIGQQETCCGNMRMHAVKVDSSEDGTITFEAQPSGAHTSTFSSTTHGPEVPAGWTPAVAMCQFDPDATEVLKVQVAKHE
eukprot:gene30698-38430_t